jgi:hypothetical protein
MFSTGAVEIARLTIELALIWIGSIAVAIVEPRWRFLCRLLLGQQRLKE